MAPLAVRIGIAAIADGLERNSSGSRTAISKRRVPSISVDTVAEGQRVFDGLAEGGQATMPFTQTFWSPGFGMVTDRFGTPWMVNVATQG